MVNSPAKTATPSRLFYLLANESPRLKLVLWCWIAALLFFGLLECWRPYYFLTDDNLSGGLPFFVDMGRRLLHGQSPFISGYIFGGSYNLLRDSTFFVWHPLVLFVSLLGDSPVWLAMLDIVALTQILFCTAGFCLLLDHLRATYQLPLSNGKLLFLVLSYTFSFYILAIAPGWLNYMGPYASLPWLVYGLLHPRFKTGFLLLVLAQTHSLLFGHANPTLFNGLCLLLFAIAWSCHLRTPAPILRLISAAIFSLFLISPLLWPSFEGFRHSARFEPLSLSALSENSVPALLLWCSFLIGTFSHQCGIIFQIGILNVHAGYAIASCAASWLFVSALISRRQWSPLACISLGLVLFSVIFISNPTWLQICLQKLPLARSLRWPFRDILQFLFFCHLFIAVHPATLPRRMNGIMAAVGTALFLVPFFTIPAPSFCPMELDRALIRSGQAELYWSKVKSLLAPDEKFVPIISNNLVNQESDHIPFSLLGAYNYPMLFRACSASGYSVSAPLNQIPIKLQPDWQAGTYNPSARAALLKENSDLRFIYLQSLHPLIITLSGRQGGPDIDLSHLARQAVEAVHKPELAQ